MLRAVMRQAGGGGATAGNPSDVMPIMDGLGTPGVSVLFSRGDHQHPSDTSRLALGGGTLTGPLVLAGNAAANLQAVPLQQLNSAIAAIPPPNLSGYLPLSGGTLAGPLVLAGNAAANLNPVPLQQMNAALAAYAPLASPVFAGTPSLPTGTVAVTQAPGDADTSIATTAFVQTAVPAASSTTPIMDSTAAVGAGTTWARADHIHPSDTSRYAATNPSGYQTAAQVTAAVAPALNDVGRNLIHNPLFNVCQRTGPWTAPGFTADRWALWLSLDTANVQRTALAAGGVPGDESAAWCIVNTFTGNAGAASTTMLSQAVEDVRRLAGKTVTVSFTAMCWAGALKLGVSLDQRFGSGGSPSATVNGIGQSVTLTTTWARYSLTFTVPSIVGKTLGTNNDHFTLLNFFFSAGANGTTQSGNVGVQAGTVQLWGVQLELGSVATPLAKIDYDSEIQQCQRFYQILPFSSIGFPGGSSTVATQVTLPVTMRAAPTVSPTTATNTNCSAASVLSVGPYTVTIMATSSAAGAMWLAGNFTASADL